MFSSVSNLLGKVFNKKLNKSTSSLPRLNTFDNVSDTSTTSHSVYTSNSLLSSAQSERELSICKNKSHTIDKQILRDNKKNEDRTKVRSLIIGAQDAGKHTLFMQLQGLYGKALPLHRRKQYSLCIQTILIKSLQCLCVIYRSKNELTDEQFVRSSDLIHNWDEKYIEDALNDAIHFVVSQISKTFEEEYGSIIFEDSSDYIMEHFERISAFDYVPSNQDILHSYRSNQKTNMSEFTYQIGKVNCSFTYLPGNIDRKKGWQSFFEGNTDYIIYCLSAASFCQFASDDPNNNRLLSAMATFEAICQDPILAKSNIVLVLNKVDMLDQRLKRYQIKDYIPFYNGKNETADFLLFLIDRMQRNFSIKRRLLIHPAIGTDTVHSKEFFESLMFISSKFRSAASSRSFCGVSII